jgi:hypothetical protein
VGRILSPFSHETIILEEHISGRINNLRNVSANVWAVFVKEEIIPPDKGNMLIVVI